MRAGATAFPISTRNSPTALAHLVRTTGLHVVFVSEDSAMRRLVEEAQIELARVGFECKVLPIPAFEELYGIGPVDVSTLEESLPNIENDVEKIALILHSSGA